ncbi:MAG: PepSY-associated TM helix domain-containing protein, partial [Flavisolibacter sp.]
MKLKKLVGKIHLWLGLATGLVVFILGLTGAIYCFAPELQSLQPYRTVEKINKSFLPPSQIQMIAENHLPGKSPQRIYYDAGDKAVMVLFSKKEQYNYSVFINPYNGEVLKVRNNDRDFLSLVLKIHR